MDAKDIIRLVQIFKEINSHARTVKKIIDREMFGMCKTCQKVNTCWGNNLESFCYVTQDFLDCINKLELGIETFDDCPLPPGEVFP